MAEQMRPSSKKNAPDPTTHFDRSKAENESGMGRMDADKPRAAKSADKMEQSVKNKQDPTRQINAEDVDNLKQQGRLSSPDYINQGMKDEEPRGEDLAPADIHDPKMKRNPRTGGKGGTPDAGEKTKRG